MNDLQKLRTALSMVEAAQAVLADAGRAIFDTCDLEDERAAIWSAHDLVKQLWNQLDARAGDLRTRTARVPPAKAANA